MKRIAVCAFSGLSGPNAGGVQLSGRIAWGSIADYTYSRGASAGLLVYGDAEDQDLCLARDGSAVCRNKWSVLWAAVSRNWRAPLVCFWHVGMLRLLPLLRVGRAKVVLFLHGIEVWRRFGPITRRLLDRVDLFLSNSDFTWQRFVDFNPPMIQRAHQVVPLGCGEATAGGAFSPEPAALILGRIMRTEDYKGHRELIAAWPRVLASIPEAQLWIAGDGDLREELQRIVAQAGLVKNIQFLGRISEEQKQERLARCRCLAMPSRGEGFGLVYLEAMRLGRPCLVSNRDAGREVVNPPEAGLAVDPVSLETLAAALCRLLTSGPEWDEWSRSARQRYESGFTAQHFRKRLLDALFGP